MCSLVFSVFLAILGPNFPPPLTFDIPSKSVSSPIVVFGPLTNGENEAFQPPFVSSNSSFELFSSTLFHILLLYLIVSLCGFASFGSGSSVSAFLFGGFGVSSPRASRSNLSSSADSRGGRTRPRSFEWCSQSMLSSRRLGRGRPQTFVAGILGLILVVMTPLSRWEIIRARSPGDIAGGFELGSPGIRGLGSTSGAWFMTGF